MALQVWLPLTKDLSNQGLYNCSITDKGATYSSSVGKLGGSYMFNPESSQSGTKYILLNATTADIFQSGQSFSLACWFKLTGSLYSNGCGLIAGNVYTNKGIGLLLWNNSGNTKVCVQMCFDGTEREWKPNITAFSQNVWYHICFTYEQSTRKLSLYINGSLVDSLIETRDWVAHTTQKIAIGLGTQGGWGYTLPGYMNDARIYDHCLSPKEVKEIAQGLVLHYPLDNILPAEMDIYEYIQSTGTQWIDTGYVLKGPFRIESDMELTQLQSFQTMYGFMISSSTITPRMGLHNYPQSTWMIGINDTVSFGTANTSRHKFVHTYENGTESVYIDGTLAKSNTKTTTELSSNAMSLGLFARNQNTVVNYSKMKLYSFKIYDNGILVRDMVPCSYKGTIGMYDRAGNKFYTNSGTGTFTLSSTKLYSYPNVVYDCSGYGNNGNVNGLITTSSDTSRYESSTKLPDSACAIGIGNLSTIVPEGIFTFNVWFKKVTGEWSSKSWETILGGPSGFELEGKLSSSQNAYVHPYNWGGGSTSTPNSYSMAYDLDKWNMVTMVRNDTGTKFYINGEFKVNGSTRGSIPSGDYFIGAWKTATQQNYRGYFSDARIYATALSDANIKELYDTAASIDNGGNLHDFECVEDKVDKGQVQKTGIVKTNEFVEKINYLYLPAGKYVSTGLAYAANDVCKAISVLRYETGGSGERDLMGYHTSSANCYWGVTAAGAWEQHGTFTYTDVDITKINTISWTTSSSTYSGTYQIGGVQNTWAKRAKFIYSVKLYKNDVLERDLIPATNGTQMGLYDLITKTFYPTNSGGSLSAEPSEAKIFDSHIEANQLIER